MRRLCKGREKLEETIRACRGGTRLRRCLMSSTLPKQERDAEVAALQEQLEQLRALEQARGLPSPGASDTPRVIAAQLQIERLQHQLRHALQVIHTYN